MATMYGNLAVGIVGAILIAWGGPKIYRSLMA
jgi:hypothetical protein